MTESNWLVGSSSGPELSFFYVMRYHYTGDERLIQTVEFQQSDAIKGPSA